MFEWWTNARRKRRLARPVDPTWPRILEKYVWQWRYLPTPIADQALEWLRIFELEKYWEGCAGLKLTDTHRVAVAAQASLMTIGMPQRFFGCQTVLIYPEDYVAPGVSFMVNGQVGVHGQQVRSGETSYRGPVILNWSAVTAAGRSHNHGHHITVHEMAHQFDFDNGPTSDGIPPLPSTVDVDRWQELFTSQLEELRDSVARGYEILIDDYGLTSLSELFAVSSENFFQIPHELAEIHPELFELLLQCYGQDWREWLPAHTWQE